ncbi:MAG: DUF211 domain-containing protein [Thermoplasmata archaeon]|nr:DUF211 domain-containing protein [Thermoplasmata archaeon]
MNMIRRLILDVLKPHNPSIVELAKRIASLPGVVGVNITLQEVDKDTDSVKITIEGDNIELEKVEEVIENCGAVIHSIDGVSAGAKIVEEISTPQDR